MPVMECVWYLKAGSKGRYKSTSRWETGVYLGVREESGEVIIGTDSGVIKSSTFKRKTSLEERYDKKRFLGMKGTPWEPTPGVNSSSIRTSIIVPDTDRERGGFETQELKRRRRIVSC